MRIAMLTPPPGVRGPLPKLVPQLAAALRDQGCVVYLQPWGRRRERESPWRKLAQRAGDIRRARRRLDAEPVDVTVVHTAHSWITLLRDVPLLLAIRRRGRVLVLHFHGSFCDRLVNPGHVAFKLASALLIGLSDAALVLSSEEQRQWQAFRPHGRFRLVRNPLPPSSPLDPPPARSRFGISGTDPIVLFVGRLIEAKGILNLVAVLAAAAPAPVFHLLVVGEGPLASQVRRDAAAAGVGERVTLTGHLAGEDLQAAYEVADVFALPSRSEGLPLVILEAMAAGLPIVTTGIRGMADHLRHEVNALTVPPDDRAALAAALHRLLADRETRTRMGAANREKVREFSPDRVGGDYLAALREAIAACGAA